MHLIISSRSDPASLSMLSYLTEKYTFTEKNGVMNHGDFDLLIIEDRHIFHDMSLSGRYDYAVVLSRHSSAANIRSLTAHPTGNFGPTADLGGKPRTINISCPVVMSGTLRRMMELYSGDKFEVTFEATHHGPLFDIPNYYVEIGTTENEWNDPDALRVTVDSVMNPDIRSYDNFVGVGGGHYAPKIKQYFKENSVNIGHIISKHDHDTLEPWEIDMAVKKTPGCKGFIMDRKGTRGSVRDMIKKYADENSLELISI
ncbi:D-aminoacyl-tRNA deacylase [Thermoplasma sp.]|uniref:D-aminoacyl-tRNA deacylase n=1 Tax=Thermoplasma sp. TaxID=1973142 RepID=UPI002627800C|nr:D-aminoacyl-tRNA deacylase [Thermoplasma sp.]